jgi:hypothetical protein
MLLWVPQSRDIPPKVRGSATRGVTFGTLPYQWEPSFLVRNPKGAVPEVRYLTYYTKSKYFSISYRLIYWHA